MWKNIDKTRMKREVLKNIWFNLDHSNTPEVKQIIVTMDSYPDRLGYGKVKIESDTSKGYSSYTSLRENPFLYLSENKEFLSGEYELIVIEQYNTITDEYR